jgi:hypothetical protein
MGNVMVRFFVSVLALFLLVSVIGCAESKFELSSESRMPKWFVVPNGVSREHLRVTMEYYIYPSGREAVFRLYQNDDYFPLEKVTGTQYGTHPLKLKIPPTGFPEGRPSYEIITVGGIVDIVEHRQREPVFYMTDDPQIWKDLGVEQK